MERIVNPESSYKIANGDSGWLMKHGFIYNGAPDGAAYFYRFDVYKYKKNPVITCTISVDSNTKDAFINVYANGGYYPPFYLSEAGVHKPLLDKIDKKIVSEMKKLGIKRRDE